MLQSWAEKGSIRNVPKSTTVTARRLVKKPNPQPLATPEMFSEHYIFAYTIRSCVHALVLIGIIVGRLYK